MDKHDRPPLAGLPHLFPSDDGSLAEADTIIGDGWRYRDHPAILVVPPVPWSDAALASAEWGRELYAFSPVAPLLSAYFETGRPYLLDAALAFASDWLEHEVDPVDELVRRSAAERVHRLAFLVDAAERLPRVPSATAGALRKSLVAQLKALSVKGALPATAAGLGEAVAALSACARFERLPALRAARGRLMAHVSTIVDSLVAADGGTLGHSPGGQAAVLARLAQLDRINSVPTDLAARAAAIEEAYTWFLAPTGGPAPIGDTEPPSLFRTMRPAFDAAGGPRANDAARRASRAFTESGWFAVRPRPRAGASPAPSYLLQICGRHSSRHKHDDDFSFVWYEEDRAILADAGPPGARARQGAPEEPGDPARVRAYAESPRAHTGATVDERSEDRPRPRHFGAGLVHSGENRHLFFSECERRLDEIRHTRVLVLRPTEWTAVVDIFHDRSGAEHEFGQRFLLGADLEAVADPEHGVVAAAFDEERSIFIVPFFDGQLIGPRRAVTEPELEGWLADRGELVPASAVRVTSAGSRQVMATLVALGREAPSVDLELTRTNTSARRIRLGWRADGRRHQIDIVRDEGLDVRYRAPRLS